MKLKAFDDSRIGLKFRIYSIKMQVITSIKVNYSDYDVGHRDRDGHTNNNNRLLGVKLESFPPVVLVLVMEIGNC